MERGESSVRAIPTVSIVIVANGFGRFKEQFVCVQRKKIAP